MLVTSAEAGRRGRERSSKEKGTGEEMWMKEAFTACGAQRSNGEQGHQTKVREQRKRWRKYILLEIGMTAVVKSTQEFRVT